jgi:hypothetical protein
MAGIGRIYLQKFTIVWGRPSVPGLELISIDDTSFCDTSEGAKQAGRDMLVGLKKTDMQPVGVLELAEEDIEKLLLSVRTIHALPHANPTEELDELEFIQMKP